jgi:hypothetical protein
MNPRCHPRSSPFTLRSILLQLGALCLAGTGAQAIVTVPGFEAPNPSADRGSYAAGTPPVIVNAQLSGLGAGGIHGSFDAPNIGFAAWEKFSSPVFSLELPQYTGNSGILTATLDQDASGPGRTTTGSNPGLITVLGVEYSGRLTTGPYDFHIDASSTLGLASVTLQIKHSPYQVDGVAVTAFSAKLNGVDSEPAIKGANLGNSSDAISLNTSYNYYTYTWNNLSLAPNQSFELDFFSGADGTGQGFSIDSIALTTSTIPEPTGAALLVVGLVTLGLRRARTRRTLA